MQSTTLLTPCTISVPVRPPMVMVVDGRRVKAGESVMKI